MTKDNEYILLKTTSPINMLNDENEIIYSGTCFFIKDDSNRWFFVTNIHIIEKSNCYSLYFSFYNKENKCSHHEFRFYDLEDVTMHPNYDLCIVEFTKHYNDLMKEKDKPILAYIPIKSIEKSFDYFKRIEDVYMVGYPCCLINLRDNLPIVRKGITGTGMCDKIKDNDTFIIDIPVYGGSSGSPVYYITEDDKVKLVGIVTGKYNEKNYLQIIEDGKITQSKTEYIKVPNGLGYVIKSNIILELVNMVPNCQ